MQTPTEEVGACVEIDPTAQLFGETVAARIVPNERTQHKHQDWLKIARAFRSDDDWKLVYRHRALLGAYLNNVYQLV